ncbi:MAG: hypothetical protein FJ030_01300 [Chloroflexi bacterium]|nr:hypothetical protein [Chloroflexota bacterium]
MRLITNEPLIKRNAAIGKYAASAGLVVLVGGLVVSFTARDNPQLQLVPFYTLIVGFILSNVGIYFANRFVREPRADKTIEAALKGLDDKYHLYNYRLPAPHVLIGPSGIFALVPKFQAGEVIWDGKRWNHKGSNFILSLFGQESLANPNAEAAAEASRVANALGKKIGGDIPPVQAIIVFYNPKVAIQAENPPIPALYVKQLKDFIRKLPKGPTLSAEQIEKLDGALGL